MSEVTTERFIKRLFPRIIVRDDLDHTGKFIILRHPTRMIGIKYHLKYKDLIKEHKKDENDEYYTTDLDQLSTSEYWNDILKEMFYAYIDKIINKKQHKYMKATHYVLYSINEALDRKRKRK